MKEKVKRFLTIVLACCLVISSSQVTSYAQMDSDDDTQNSAITSESGTTASTENDADDEEEESSGDASNASAAGKLSAADEQTENAADDEDASGDSADEGTSAQDGDTSGASAEEAFAEDEAAGKASAEKNLTVGLMAANAESSEDEETAEMPAVTLKKKIGDITVTVEAPKGAFAEGVTMTVEAVEGTDAEDFLDAVAEQDFSQYDETYTVIDAAVREISFYVNGEEVEPAAEVKVTISGLDLATEDEDGREADYALVYHMDDEGNVEYVEADQNEQVGLDSYSFTTSEFSAYGIVNVDVEYGVMVAAISSNAGNAGHIDIGVNATASVTIGYTTYSNSSIGISASDFTSGNVTITAVQGSTALTGSSSSSDWRKSGSNGNATYTITNSSVDFVYNLSDLSSSSGESGINQVRIGGCFPVGSKSNPVKYTMTLTKSVTLYEDGDTSSSNSITVTVTLTATFGYWDSDNDCPGLNKTSWNNGGFSSGSGLDFVLSVSSTTRPTVTVYKYVEDEDGNLLTEASGESFGYSITSTNNNVSTTETGSVTVGSSGVGVATTDVTNSSNYTVTETSYPAAIGDYSFVSSSVSYDGSTATIINVYGVKTIDIPVEKVWSDDDYNGNRPNEITVILLANGETVKDDSGNDVTVTLNESNNWKASFTGLDIKDNAGKEITYTISEDTVAGYASAISGNASEGFTITNTLETGSLTLKKTVKADNSIDTGNFTFTFYVKGNNGELENLTSVSNGTNSYSVSNGVATVTVPAGGSVTLLNLPVGSYTVYETSGSTVTANGHTWTVSGDNNKTVAVEADTIVSATITNTITGDAVVSITKNWDDQSNYWNTRPTNDGTTFAVTLTATGTNGESYTYTTDATWVEGTDIWTLDLSGVAAYDTEGNMLTYTVTETAVEGYTLVEDTITVTPASDRNVSLTNTLKTATVTVTKTVLDSNGNEVSSTENDDDFRFALYESSTLASYGTATLTAGGTAAFTVPLGTYSLTEYLVGSHDHSYDTTVIVNGTKADVTETFDSTEGVKYHTVTFTLDDEDTGKNIAVAVTNQEEEISLNLATLVNGSKTLTSDNAVTKTFTYTVKEAAIIEGVETESESAVATGTVTISNGETKGILWNVLNSDAFTYDEVGTYYYVIYEDVATGTGTGGVLYDATRYTLTITVTKDEKGGGLIATASMTGNVQNDDGTRSITTVKSDKNADYFTAATTDASFTADDSFTASFTNTYDAAETSIILRATKVLTGRTLSEDEFSIVVQQIDENGNNIGEAVTRSNGATGAFGYEIVYDKAGTYYYKVSELKGSLGSVDYDGHYYIVTVTVKDEDGVLTVDSTDVKYYDASGNEIDGTYSFDSMVFTNTYTAKGSGSLSTYKVMQGRDFNAGETFTFLIEAMDSGAPILTNPDNGVNFTDNGDGTYTVTVTVPDNVADGTTILKETLADINVDQDDVGEWVYRVTETAASDINGMTLDTATYGHLITVTVADDGYGKMTVTPKSTNDTDWNKDGKTDTTSSVIVNTFSPGIKTIYGKKVWVDGDASHDNSSEVTLELYYSTNGTTWYQYPDAYTVTWGTANTNDWHIAGLPIYDADGNTMYYRVAETYNNGNSYTTTYGDSGSSTMTTIPEDNDSDNRYTIINTIKQEEVSISGTKTWVEATETTHDNAEELVLTVSRNSDSTNLTNLIQEDGNGTGADGTYIVVWSGNEYNIYWYKDSSSGEYVGLPLYDSKGYTYSYRVVESYAPEHEGKYADYEEDDAVFTYISDTEVTFDFTNRAPDDTEEDPTKTENGTGADATVNGQSVVEYGEVAVGDQITYTISYYNNANDTATIRITDPLDSGVDFVSASYNSVILNASDTDDAKGTGATISYDNTTHTVTWEIETAAFTSGSVTVTVVVNSSARTLISGETEATVDNQAAVYNTETSHTAQTEIVTNPLKEDDDEKTEKDIISVTYEDEEGNEYTRTEEDGTNVYVQEGDQIHYIISRYNNTNETVTFVIVDTLDEGVTYTYSSYGSSYYNSASTVTVSGDTYNIPAHSVVWIATTNPYSYATVQMTVTVNSSAKAAAQTYGATEPGTYSTGGTVTDYDSYTYGTGDNTTASVANQAVAYTVGNDIVSYSNVIENPLKPDDPVDPVKSEPYRTATDGLDEDGNVEDTDEDGEISDETVTYEAVAVSEIVEYRIDYYNNHNTAAIVTITDKLDDDVQFVDASDGGTYDASTHTVTWIIENAAPLTSGFVEMQVQVLSSAVSERSVKNQASMQIGNDTAVSTNTVENPVDDNPGDPMKEVSDDSEAGEDGDNVKVGDEITYEITYYNHNSEEATITIVDTLDENVELVGATDKDSNPLYNGITGAVSFLVDSVTGKVTWSFTAEAYEVGTVTITVQVKDGAQGTTVKNQASVQVGNDAAVNTNVVENPVDDESENPVKTETEIVSGETTTTPIGILNDTDTVVDENTALTDSNIVTCGDVAVNDEITYTISYYNHYGDTATVTITDILDSGVTYVDSSDNGAYNSYSRIVTWTIEDVPAYTEGTVTLTVRVNNSARTIITGETEATVDNQAAVTITEDDNSVKNNTNIVVNPLKDDDPTDPTKTEYSVLDDSTGTISRAHVTDTATEGNTTYITYGDVAVGDQITYRISYTNHMNGVATVTIADELDEGVDFVSAQGEDMTGKDVSNRTKNVTYVLTTDSNNRVTTVTWTIYDVDPYGTGMVSLTVKVNENAKVTENGETEATVENSATETNSLDSGNEYTTNVVVNPLEDDDPEEPVKTETALTDSETEETVEPTLAESSESEDGTITDTYCSVSVGDQITYTITYYNYQNEAVDVMVTDALDKGVTFVSATNADGDVVTSGYSAVEHTYTWEMKNVSPLTMVTVTLTVKVNEAAKLTDEEGEVASVENQATVIAGEVENRTNIVVNELESEDPEDPVKAISESSPSGYDADAVIEYDADDATGQGTLTGSSVGIGSVIAYTIEYYNYTNAKATITITDVLDPGVDFLSVSDDGVYNESTHTVTWELTVEALTEGTVVLNVQVNENAKTIESDETQATVKNQATVTIGENNYDTDLVINPVDPDDPGDPEKVVSADSEAGVDGASVSVGDKITYEIGYYNHTNETATVTITDKLQTGAEYFSSTDGGTVADGVVTWVIKDVEPYTGGTVKLTIEVTEDALEAITVNNQATVKIGDNEATTNLVINPIDDDPVDPIKSVDVGNSTEVSVGDTLVYTITYYNHLSTAATVTITDTLDEGLAFVSASDGGTYDTGTRTVTWTIEDVSAFTEGSVTLKVKVNNDADTSVENTAKVSIGGEDAVSTNTVENPVEEGTTAVTKTKTGDTNMLYLWIFLLIASAAGIFTLGEYERKRRHAAKNK